MDISEWMNDLIGSELLIEDLISYKMCMDQSITSHLLTCGMEFVLKAYIKLSILLSAVILGYSYMIYDMSSSKVRILQLQIM